MEHKGEQIPLPPSMTSEHIKQLLFTPQLLNPHKHMMAFLKEVQYSHPPTFIKKLAWDFPLVLVTLQAPPYEPT